MRLLDSLTEAGANKATSANMHECDMEIAVMQTAKRNEFVGIFRPLVSIGKVV